MIPVVDGPRPVDRPDPAGFARLGTAVTRAGGAAGFRGDELESTIREDCTLRQAVDRAVVERIDRLLDDTLRDPFTGIGRPGRLTHAFAGSWSRRITDEHRLVHIVDGEDVTVHQCRFHYD